MAHQRDLDLAGLDAVAPELELAVLPPAEPDDAVLLAATEISGPIHPRPRPPVVRPLDEPEGGFLRIADVAERDLWAEDADLADGSARNLLGLLVEQHHTGPRKRTPDRYRLADRQLDLVRGGEHRRLGGSVGVDQSRDRGVTEQAARERRGECLTARDDRLQRRGQTTGAPQFGEDGGSVGEHGHPGFEVGDRQCARDDPHRAADGQRTEHLQNERVEAERDGGGGDGQLLGREGRVDPLQHAGQALVGDFHRLRATRRPRGEEDVRGGLRCGLDQEIAVGRARSPAAEDRGRIEHGEPCVETVRTAGGSDHRRDADPLAHRASLAEGYSGSRGTYVARAPQTPSMAATASFERGRHTPTRSPEPMPHACNSVVISAAARPRSA